MKSTAHKSLLKGPTATLSCDPCQSPLATNLENLPMRKGNKSYPSRHQGCTYRCTDMQSTGFKQLRLGSQLLQRRTSDVIKNNRQWKTWPNHISGHSSVNSGPILANKTSLEWADSGDVNRHLIYAVPSDLSATSIVCPYFKASHPLEEGERSLTRGPTPDRNVSTLCLNEKIGSQ